MQQMTHIARHLRTAQKKLETHALTQNKWGLVPMTMHYLQLQSRWDSAGPLVRLLIGLQAALIAYEQEKSAAGFVGPYLQRCHEGIIDLMAASLPPEAIGKRDLLSTGTLTMAMITLFMTTQNLGNWKGMFPQIEPASAKRGGLFYQELGLMWVFGSHTMEQCFSILTKGLEIDAEKEETIAKIGAFYMLLLSLAAVEESSGPQIELWDSLQRYIKKFLDATDKALQAAKLDEHTAKTASTHLQLIRLTLENNDIEALPQTIKSALQAFDVPYEGVREDIKSLIGFCLSLRKTFENIFHQTAQTVTTMDQAA